MAISVNDFLNNWSDHLANVEAGPVLPGEGRKVWPRDGSAPGRGGFEVASHNGGAPIIPQHQHQAQFANSDNPLGPPLSIDINTTDGALERAGFKYHFPQNQSGGQFNIGGSYEPGYSTSAPGFFPGETVENEVPMNYRVNAGYGGKNWNFNWSHGNNRGHGVNLNTNMQF